METIYRWKLKSLIPYLPILLFFCMFPAFLDLFVISVFKNTPLEEIPFIFWCASIGAIFITASLLIALSLPIIQAIFGYIKISPEGLEYKRWPLSKQIFKWEYVTSIHQGTINTQIPFLGGTIKYGSLLIQRSKPGWEIKTPSGVLGSRDYHGIPISEFQGWDDGSLVENLKLHAPHLTIKNFL